MTGMVQTIPTLLMSVFTIHLVISVSDPSLQIHDELSRREVLNRTLKNSRYDPRIPPDYERDYPTNVTLQIHILSFDSVSEASMDYTINIYLREKWTDPRLTFMNYTRSEWLELDTRMIDRVWVPDVYFQNEKKAAFHNVTVPNRLLHLYPNGTVNYSLRLSLTLTCHMELDKYPMDTQHCPIIIQSYSYSKENVVFTWSEIDPITLNTNMELPQFNFVNYHILPCTDVYEDRFACIMAKFKLKRDMGYFILQVYVPSILIVILSWISFWIDVGAVPARISLGVLTVLTMTTQSSGAQSSLPRVSYVKAIDVWMAMCLIFVFTALLEFAYVNVAARRSQKHPERYEMRDLSTNRKRRQKDITEEDTLDDEVAFKDGDFSMEEKPALCPFSARRIDKISRVIFPVVFVICNLLYWSIYLNVDIKH